MLELVNLISLDQQRKLQWYGNFNIYFKNSTKNLSLLCFQMGYGKSSQKTQGIHIRQHSRAFAFQDDQGKNNVFVSVDSGMMGQLVKKKVNSVIFSHSKLMVEFLGDQSSSRRVGTNLHF